MASRFFITSNEVIFSAHKTFGVSDSKGRSVGVTLRIQELAYRAAVGDEFGPNTDWKFFATLQVTRDGAVFGSSRTKVHGNDWAQLVADIHAKAAKVQEAADKKFN